MSIWNDNPPDLFEAFSEAETPLGCYLAGMQPEYAFSAASEELIRMSAEGGCKWGQYVYSLNSNVRISGEKRFWLEKAAQNHHPAALFALGSMRLLEGDFEGAFECFSEGAELEHWECLIEVADL
jgi:hypothetical protein